MENILFTTILEMRGYEKFIKDITIYSNSTIY